jgi:small-conductance mechanosensitive channel
MGNKFVGTGKLFFRGFSKIFKGPQDSGRVATIGGVKPKISTKKSDQIKRSNRLIKDLEKTMKKDMSPQMKKRGEKLKKEVKDTQKKVYRSKMAIGGIIDKFRTRTKTKTKKPKTEIKKGPMKAKPDNKGQKMTPDKSKKLKEGIKEKILPQKKKDRLNELRKELGMKKGGKAKFPDLTGDGKVTRADILKGRGVFRKGGASK